MKKKDIQELLDLKGWSTARLAAEMELTENAIWRWLNVNDRLPKGPAAVLLRIWLKEARRENGVEKDMATAS